MSPRPSKRWCGAKCGTKNRPENKRQSFQLVAKFRGGEGGIRTPDRLAPMPHFECGAFDHSATSPGAIWGDSSPAVGASSRRGWRTRQGAAPTIPQGPAPGKEAKMDDGSGQWRGVDVGPARCCSACTCSVCNVSHLEMVGPPDATKTLAAPCRYIEILAGKCGFTGQPERRSDASNACRNGNAISVLT